MEQTKILLKLFKQILHITDIKRYIIGIRFVAISKPTMNILNTKLQIKDKIQNSIKHL